MTSIELQNFRKRKNLNMVQTAELIGVHPSQITRWEMEKQKIPRWLDNFIACLDRESEALKLVSRLNLQLVSRGEK